MITPQLFKTTYVHTRKVIGFDPQYSIPSQEKCPVVKICIFGCQEFYFRQSKMNYV